MTDTASLELHDVSPDDQDIAGQIRNGLTSDPRWLPTLLLYDERGSELFDQICEVDEYYLTRAEMSIMREHAPDMARELGPRCRLVDYGSGTSEKARLLLDQMEDIAAYVPVDISQDFLMQAAASINKDYPALTVLPTAADFTRSFTVPDVDPPANRTAVYFPGSTICNMEPHIAKRLCEGVAELTNGGSFLVGADIRKDIDVMEAAYNDREGVTAEFNYNMVDYLARDFGLGISRDNFRFRAEWEESEHAIVSRLYATKTHSITGDGWQTEIKEGERIRTERSYKYSLDEFRDLLAQAGLKRRKVWTDKNGKFSVQLFDAD